MSLFKEGARQSIQSNRNKLYSIREKIFLCGHQNIALHGHRDSGADMEDAHAASTNHDHFWVLLLFHILVGDTILRDHLKSVTRNATYTSADIQNQ